MSKRIKDQNGNVYVKKKPFYRRFWFLLLVFILVVGVASQMGNDKKDTASSKSQTEQTESKKKDSSSKEPDVPTEYKSALNKAKNYSETMNMSKQGIYDQLTAETGEQFSADAAQYAINNLTDVDWNANALNKAKEYQKEMDMSPEAIRDQLTSESGEQFTEEEAEYAIQNLEA